MSESPFSDPLGSDGRAVYDVVQKLQSLKTYLAPLGDDLNQDVDNLIGEAGWQGDAADSFRATWESDYASLAGLVEYIDSCRSVVATFLSNISYVNRAFEAAVSEAQRAGVAMGPDYKPLRPWEQVCTANPISYPATAAGFYAYNYDTLKRQLDEFRHEAANKLCGFHDVVAESSGSSLSTQLTLANLLYDLYPTIEEVNAVAPGGTTRASTKLMQSVAELDKVLPRGISAALDAAPVVDLAFSQVGAVIQIQTLQNEGETSPYAVATAESSAWAGLLAGASFSAFAIGVVASLPVDLTVGAVIVAGGVIVLASGIVAIGAADLVTDVFDEHWDQDWHDRGPLGGTALGLSHVVTNTLADTAGDVGDAGSFVIGKGSDLLGGIGNVFGL
jgi:uncharacterized protein YukE